MKISLNGQGKSKIVVRKKKNQTAKSKHTTWFLALTGQSGWHAKGHRGRKLLMPLGFGS